MSLKSVLLVALLLLHVAHAGYRVYEEEEEQSVFNYQVHLRVFFRVHGPKDRSKGWDPTDEKYNKVMKSSCYHIDLMQVATKIPSLSDFSITVPLPSLLPALGIAMAELHENCEVEIVSMNGFTEFKENIHIYTEAEGQRLNVTEDFGTVRKHLVKENLKLLSDYIPIEYIVEEIEEAKKQKVASTGSSNCIII